MDEHDRSRDERDEIRVERDEEEVVRDREEDDAARNRTPANEGDVLGISRVPAGGMEVPGRSDAERDREEESAPDLSKAIEEHHGLGSRDVTQGTSENHYRTDRRR